MSWTRLVFELFYYQFILKRGILYFEDVSFFYLRHGWNFSSCITYMDSITLAKNFQWFNKVAGGLNITEIWFMCYSMIFIMLAYKPRNLAFSIWWLHVISAQEICLNLEPATLILCYFMEYLPFVSTISEEPLAGLERHLAQMVFQNVITCSSCNQLESYLMN